MLQVAAQQLSVGVTTLKNICRTARVNRWPFRKRTSIERLIERTEYFMPMVDDDAQLQQHLAALQTLLDHKDDFKVTLGTPSFPPLSSVMKRSMSLWLIAQTCSRQQVAQVAAFEVIVQCGLPQLIPSCMTSTCGQH